MSSLTTGQRVGVVLAAVDLVAVTVWVRFWFLDLDLDPQSSVEVAGSLFLVPPTAFVVLACLGFVLLARHELEQRGRPPLVFLSWASWLVLMPLVFYGALAVGFLGFAYSGGVD